MQWRDNGIYHCPPLSVYHCIPLSTFATPLSTIVCHLLLSRLSTVIYHCLPLSTTVSPLSIVAYHSPAIVYHCLPLSTIVYRCLRLSTAIFRYLPLSTIVSPLSTIVKQWVWGVTKSNCFIYCQNISRAREVGWAVQ